MVQHNSISDHEAVKIGAPLLIGDKTMLGKHNLEIFDNWHVLDNHETVEVQCCAVADH